MDLEYKLQELKELIDDFNRVTGETIMILNTKFESMVCSTHTFCPYCLKIQESEEGLRRCLESDSFLAQRYGPDNLQPQIHQCHAGLTDFLIPIQEGGHIFGYLLLGQMRKDQQKSVPFSRVYNMVADLNLDYKDLEEKYRNVPCYTDDQIESMISLLLKLGKYIIFDHLITSVSIVSADDIKNYIDKNIQEELTVANICERFSMSKNALYKFFKDNFNSTVLQYINNCRLVRAQKLLVTTDLTVYEICELVGIPNYQYFCRFFKNKMGRTPLQYRSRQRSSSPS